MLRQETAAEERIVRATPPFIALVPYAARGPLEVWIVPRQHGCSYEEGLTADTASALAELLSQLFRALEQGFGDPGYEMVLHTAPNLKSRILQGDWATIRDDYHWHIEIAAVPERVNRVGGIYVDTRRRPRPRPPSSARPGAPSPPVRDRDPGLDSPPPPGGCLP